MFIEVVKGNVSPIFINVDRVRWVQASSIYKGSTVVVFDNDDYLTVEESYEEVCKRIKELQG